MTQRRRFSAKYKREAAAMLDAPGASVSQIASELGIGTNVPGHGPQVPVARRTPTYSPRFVNFMPIRRHGGESADLGGSALCRGAV